MVRRDGQLVWIEVHVDNARLLKGSLIGLNNKWLCNIEKQNLGTVLEWLETEEGQKEDKYRDAFLRHLSLNRMIYT